MRAALSGLSLSLSLPPSLAPSMNMHTRTCGVMQIVAGHMYSS
jgi:hypothetical protein